MKNALPQLVVCPACQQTTKPGYNWCPYCGTSLKPHPCQYCRQTMQPGDRICQFCGAPALL